MTVDFDFIYQTDETVILVLFLVMMFVAGEIGFRRGRGDAARINEKAETQVSVVEGSLLGVLGLLLGFTMSMAVTRFEVRKQLVLEEANAIGTSWLRTQMLSAPDNTEIANLLRDYVDLRFQYPDAVENSNGLTALRRRTHQLQAVLWSRAVSYNQKDPSPIRSGLLLQSLNAVIDLEASRWMALYNHVPAAVIVVNAAVAWLAALLVGYAIGIDGKRQILPVFLLAIAITVVLGVIIDLDRPHQGLIRVNQGPIVDLHQQLHAPRD